VTGPRDERGAAVVVAIALVAVLVFVAAICVGSVGIVLAHRRAQAAADLASLAGAGALQRGDDPCAAATMIAERHEAAMTDCVVDGRAVVVATAIELPLALTGRPVAARARAGPVTGQ
jgi:secretion/DNA translocation related TadE-like protein